MIPKKRPLTKRQLKIIKNALYSALKFEEGFLDAIENTNDKQTKRKTRTLIKNFKEVHKEISGKELESFF